MKKITVILYVFMIMQNLSASKLEVPNGPVSSAIQEIKYHRDHCKECRMVRVGLSFVVRAQPVVEKIVEPTENIPDDQWLEVIEKKVKRLQCELEQEKNNLDGIDKYLKMTIEDIAQREARCS